MMVLVSYDVSTIDAKGRRRLRRVAKTCLDFGQRVQKSVFECRLDPTQWTTFRLRLLEIIDDQEDSLRVYYLGSNWKGKIEHYGAKRVPDLDEPLVV